MVDAEYNVAQSFHFLKVEALPSLPKDKVKICSNLKSAWLKLDEEYGQADIVALSMVEGLVKLTLKAHGDHSQTLYDAWKRCEGNLKEISQESCLQEQQAIKDVVIKMPNPIKEMYLL